MHFSVIKNFYQKGKVNHKLSDIILLTICGVLSGQYSCEGISDFGNTRLDFLKSYDDFTDCVPSPDTIPRVMGMINLK